MMYIFSTYVKWLHMIQPSFTSWKWNMDKIFTIFGLSMMVWSRKSIFEFATNGSHLKWGFALRDIKKKIFVGYSMQIHMINETLNQKFHPYISHFVVVNECWIIAIFVVLSSFWPNTMEIFQFSILTQGN